MAELTKVEQFLIKEYDAARSFTYHVDELRSKLTQFFLAFTGFATAALSILVKGETKTVIFAKPAASIALLVLVAAFLGTCFIAIIGRLRRNQIEHFRITNNIRTYFLGANYAMWNIVQLSARTLPNPNRSSGSYFWVLLIILGSSYLYQLTTYVHLTKVFGFTNYNAAYLICAAVFIVSVMAHDRLYLFLAKPAPSHTYSAENTPEVPNG